MGNKKTSLGTLLLEPHKELANRAHYGTSHVPEKRGNYMITHYSKHLQDCINELEEVYLDQVDEFKEKYIRLFIAWMSAKGSCTSSMITGPSGYNQRRAEKANRSEGKRSEEFHEFPDKFMYRLKKQKIRQDFEDAGLTQVEIDLQKARKDLGNREKLQRVMKAVNKVCRNKSLSEEDKLKGLKDLGFKVQSAYDLIKPNHLGTTGFAGYQLTNNNANIKRLKGRVAELEAKVNAQSDEQIEYRFNIYEGGYIALNYEADRLQVFFDQGKPSDSVRATLKNAPVSLRWSGRYGCWQRKITVNGARCLNDHFSTKISRL